VPTAATLPGVEEQSTSRVRLAALLIGLQAGVLLGYGGYLAWQSRTAEASNDEVAAEIPWFFFGLGVLVLLVAIGLARRSGFAYGAAVAVALLSLAIAWEMSREDLWLGAIPVAMAAAVTLWALWSRPGRAAFGRDQR
jgi:hypothetical protein